MLVATFNLQNSFSSLKAQKRMDAQTSLIRQNNLDIVGVQEFTRKNKDYLERSLDDYIFIGDSRGSIGITDEYNSILIKKGLFTLGDYKTYSLSSDINKRGGRLTLDSFPRICTLVHLKDDEKSYLIVNTHLDNVLPHNRKCQLEILKHIIGLERQSNESLIVMGDFNMRLKKCLLDFSNDLSLCDACDTLGSSLVHVDFKKPLDHIFISGDLDATDVSFMSEKYNGVYPSDHFPVKAVIRKLHK